MLVTLGGIVVVVYVQVNKAFLGFLAVLEGLDPSAQSAKASTPCDVLLLLVLQALILLLGVIARAFGLLTAIPMVACSTASAYRQLFGTGTRTSALRMQ